MDATTLAVRAMYEQFPYPSETEPAIRVGADVRLLLSYGQLQRPSKRPLQVLDAGCGRAIGTLGGAASQPDVQFTGIDINRVALAAAAAKAVELGLKNVRFQEVDSMTLEGLELPDGGFDLIVSSGVLHHLAAPEEGLRQVQRVLAPHGMLSLLVYGTLGREPLYRMVRAVDLLVPRDRPVAERLMVARRLAREMIAEPLRVGPIGLRETIHDNEFVDRYLNVNETSYDVASLFDLLQRNGLKFLRWIEPAEWLLPTRESGSDLGAGLTELQRYQLVEQLSWRHQLFLVACQQDNRPRQLPGRDQWAAQPFALNPEVSIHVETRNLRGSQRVERITYTLRSHPPVQVGGLSASVLLSLKDQTVPFQGKHLMEQLRNKGVDRAGALNVIAELLDREILYSPHATEA
jgi:SAM-dependent methyltransferase